MRTKLSHTMYFDFSKPSSVKVAEEYRAKYEAVSQLLDANPQILDLAHQDWEHTLSTSDEGRDGYTSEQILRALIVMFLERDSYRGVVIRIDTSEFLQNFVRLGIKPTMDFTFLSRAFCFLSEKTVETMNKVLSGYAVEEEKITGEKLRMDTTAYETNIHYPTDSSLLWDSFRTLSHLQRQIHNDFPELKLRHRYHDKKVKKLATYIARNASSTSKKTQKKVKSNYRKLIESVRWIYGIGCLIQGKMQELGYESEILAHYLPLVDRIINQAYKRVFENITLPADEKLYSLFEEHTELIKRGKAGKPVEFGHKILIAQTGEKFIHHYLVMPKKIEDKDLLHPALEAHEQLFEQYPDVLAADKGFYESMGKIKELEKDIATVSIAKKGNRNAEEYERETSDEFLSGQRFRAGSEGSISVLKRAFKLGKCYFKGFKNYAASVGLAVLCHNLVLLTKL